MAHNYRYNSSIVILRSIRVLVLRQGARLRWLVGKSTKIKESQRKSTKVNESHRKSMEDDEQEGG